MTVTSFDIDAVDFMKGGGLITVVAQDSETGEVLMVAHGDREALELTIETGEMHYRSRTRGVWHKGATSGNVQRVVSLSLDCDGDAVLAQVIPAGPACHTGQRTCFTAGHPEEALRHTDHPEGASAAEGSSPGVSLDVFSRLDATITKRALDPSAESPSYTRKLLSDRSLRLKKIGEEAAEFVLAAADGDRPRAIEEAADLMYHTLVALRALGAGVDDIRRELEKREGRM